MGAFILVIDVNVNPVLVHLGPLAVRWYGVMYVVGIVAGLKVALPFAELIGINSDRAYEVFWPVLVAALLGGRFYYVVQSDFAWYLHHPGQILATWEGGMAFYGAVFLGVPVAFLACRRSSVSFPKFLDAAALFIPLAQTFGRVGNVINGDIVGPESALPWAFRYVNSQNSFVSSHTVAYQPAAVYELLFSLSLFAALFWLKGRLPVPGDMFALWLILYSAGQFVLFFARTNPVVLLDLKQAQITALVVIAVAAPLAWTWRRAHGRNMSRERAANGEPAEATGL